MTKSNSWDTEPELRGNNKLPVPISSNAWQTEDADFESLEDLLSLVEANISKGGYIADVLQRKYLPEGEKKTTSPIETNSSQYALSASKQEKLQIKLLVVQHRLPLYYRS